VPPEAAVGPSVLVPTTDHGVIHVVLTRTRTQVVNVDAFGVVAGMEDQQVSVPIVLHPYEAVGLEAT